MTVLSDGGHQPAVRPRSTLPPRTESPCPPSPSSPERGQSLPALSRGDAGTDPWLSAPSQHGARCRGRREPAGSCASSPQLSPTSSSGLSLGEFKQKVYLHLTFRNSKLQTACAESEGGRAWTNSGLCCLIGHSSSSVKQLLCLPDPGASQIGLHRLCGQWESRGKRGKPITRPLLNTLALRRCGRLPDLPGGHGKSPRVLVNLLVLECAGLCSSFKCVQTYANTFYKRVS